jgi:hypothetical protein
MNILLLIGPDYWMEIPNFLTIAIPIGRSINSGRHDFFERLLIHIVAGKQIIIQHKLIAVVSD